MKQILVNIGVLVLSILITLLVIEGMLHLFPVNEGLRTQPVNEESPIVHFEPNRTSTWSRLPSFAMRNVVHSNNHGFINDQDYTSDDQRPLIAVIGDSYVEAAMVPYANTLHGRLAASLKDSWRVYSFGVSGAPLSQYLLFAQYARQHFSPQKMIIVIIANDYDESLIQYKQAPGLHYFSRQPNEQYTIKRIDYSPSLATELLRRSKLAMYLVTNLQAQHALQLFTNDNNSQEFVGQTSASTDETRVILSKEAVDFFLYSLPEYAGLPPEDIIFIVDGLRPHLYSKAMRDKKKSSYAAVMNSYFIEKATQLGFDAIDLEPVFIKAYKAKKKKFEYEQDGHWNDLAHGLVSDVILKRLQQQ